MLITLALVSVVEFIVINLPPGSYLDVYRAQLMVLGTSTADQQIKALEQRYALDRPLYYQYFKWITGFVRGRFWTFLSVQSRSLRTVWARIGFTVVVSLCSLIFSWAVAIPIGIYSATHKYSGADNLFIPVFHRAEHPEFSHCPCPDGYLIPGLPGIGRRPVFQGLRACPWSWAKFVDFLQHLWIPVVVVGLADTAGLVRVMRATSRIFSACSTCRPPGPRACPSGW